VIKFPAEAIPPEIFLKIFLKKWRFYMSIIYIFATG